MIVACDLRPSKRLKTSTTENDLRIKRFSSVLVHTPRRRNLLTATLIDNLDLEAIESNSA